MKLFELIVEERASGHDRLVASIISMIKKRRNKTVSKISIEHYLKTLEKDTAFYNRILKKAKKIGGKGAENYYWQSIRMRTIAHFSK